ncbi:MAG: hypothetical protein ACOZNI_34835 [Myxococcota bacterium]
MWLLGLFLFAAAPLSTGEVAALARRDVVTRVEDREMAASMIGFVRVDAPPQRVLAAAMEVERFEGIDHVSSVRVYDRGPDHVAARIEVRAFGMRRAYHVVYRADRARGRIDYALDPGRSNDVARLDGSYEFEPFDGGTLVVNRVSGEDGGLVPASIRRWALARGMREKLEVIRAAAEDPAL